MKLLLTTITAICVSSTALAICVSDDTILKGDYTKCSMEEINKTQELTEANIEIAFQKMSDDTLSDTKKNEWLAGFANLKADLALIKLEKLARSTKK